MYKLLFEIIMSNQCNKRCSYCKLDFIEKKISNDNLDNLIKVLDKWKNKLESVIINFFWGEPLLNFKWIEYFVEKAKNLNFIEYSIWTNWVLLDEKTLNYFIKNNFKIHLSLDSENTNLLLKNEFLKKGIDNIEINYIINPRTIVKSFNDFRKIINFWFKKINVMPVYFTIKWDKESFIILNKLLNEEIKKYIWRKEYKINFFSYFNGVSSDIQYILETDWTIYSDLDSLLWIQKQWSILWDKLIKRIEKETLIWDIADINFDKLINQYNIKDIVRLVHDIPKEQGLVKDYKILNKIFNG